MSANTKSVCAFCNENHAMSYAGCIVPKDTKLLFTAAGYKAPDLRKALGAMHVGKKITDPIVKKLVDEDDTLSAIRDACLERVKDSALEAKKAMAANIASLKSPQKSPHTSVFNTPPSAAAANRIESLESEVSGLRHTVTLMSNQLDYITTKLESVVFTEDDDLEDLPGTPVASRGAGRPPGSKNKTKPPMDVAV